MMLIGKLENMQVSVENALSGVSAILLSFMMIVTTVDVVLRYVFGSPLPGIFSLCQMVMVGVVYFAVAFVQQQKGHVRVDVVIDRLAGNPRAVMEIATLLVALAAFGMMFWKTGQYAWRSWVTQDFEMGLVEYPFWPARTAIFLGVGILCLRLVTDIRHYHAQLREGSDKWIILSFLAVLPLALLILYLFTGSFGMEFEPTTVGWALLLVMIVVLFGGLPVAFALLALGIIGYWTLGGPSRTLSIVGIIPYAKVAQYTLTVIPLFILMGNFTYHGGFANSLYLTTRKWVGRIPGGLAQATVVGGALFGAACGSGLASCAILSRICVPEMRNAGIDTKLAIGTVAGTGTIAVMIPPSVLMVIYAIITDQSVAALLIAGIIPGLVAAFWYMVMIYVRCKCNPSLSPQLLENITWKDRFKSLGHSWGTAALGLIVMGGIYTGVFTPSEAGALGAAAALALGVFARKLKFKTLKEALTDATKTTAMIFLIIATAMVFGCFLGISRVPTTVSDFLLGLQVPRIYILMGILLMYVIAGFFIDMLAFAFLTLPIIFPAIQALGYDPLWFGVITVHMFEVALVTPPFGLNLFIIRGMTGVPMGEIIRGVSWFVAMDMVTLASYVAFPQLATWLPSMMR